LQDRVREHQKQALLSKKLATIDRDVPVGVGIDELKRTTPELAAIEAVFNELEFRTLWKRVQNLLTGVAPLTEHNPSQLTIENRIIDSKGYQMDLFDSARGVSMHNRVEGTRLFASGPSSTSAALGKPHIAIHDSAVKPYRTMADVQVDYHLVNDDSSRQKLVERLLQEKVLAFDTEATGLDPLTAELVGMSFSFAEGTGYYVDCGTDHMQIVRVIEQFRPVFERKDLLVVGQNLKFDLHIMRRYGVEVIGTLWDTMLAHYLMDPESRHNMEHMSEVYLHYSPQPISELIGKKGAGQRNMRDVEPGVVAKYASEDADVTLQLHNKFGPMLQEKGVEKLFEKLEMPLLPVLASMEWEGVRVDPVVLHDLSNELARQIKEKEQEVFDFAGLKFNLASPRQLGEVLFGSLRLDPKARKTPGGQFKTDEEVLLGLAARHPIVRAVLDFRQAQKLRSTYTEALAGLIHPETGRVHTSYNQAVAATGRLSSNQPNLQNIPIRTEKGREIRKAFVARDAEHCLLSADYSQIELRIMASVSGDPHMMQAFANGLDIHAATAGRVYGIDPSKVDEHLRRKAKTVNFGIIYGISAFGLSQRLGIPRQEAADLISQYFTAYPGIKDYMHETIASARSRGYVETLMGRRRYIRDIQSANANLRGFAERNAINAPIQGSAADMIKMAMIRIHREMKQGQFRSRMILQVHDELVFDVYRPELEAVRGLVVREMVEALPLKVPVVVDAGVGGNWLEAH
jgi:DNA polymerase-1